MRRTRSLLSAAMLVAAGLLLGPACFSPEEPDCSFRCADSVGNSNHCPENYTCQADGYCHRNGTSSTCSYGLPPDMSVPALVDMTAAPDLSSTPDLTPASDGSNSD